MTRAIALFATMLAGMAWAGDVTTNAVHFHDAPPWLGESRLNDAVRPIENVLEWDIRRIEAFRHADLEQFRAESNLKFGPVAFFRRRDGTIHVGPTVNDSNFDKIFGHELVHAIFWQKYKGAIPVWLEEGLANYLGRTSTPDYRWLRTQPKVAVTSLVHPDKDESGSRFHYEASTAAIAMIAAKCSLKDLLQLSVGKKMENYLSTFCEIPDVNAAFQEWITAQAEAPVVKTAPAKSGAEWWKKPKEKQWWDKPKSGN